MRFCHDIMRGHSVSSFFLYIKHMTYLSSLWQGAITRLQ